MSPRPRGSVIAGLPREGERLQKGRPAGRFRPPAGGAESKLGSMNRIVALHQIVHFPGEIRANAHRLHVMDGRRHIADRHAPAHERWEIIPVNLIQILMTGSQIHAPADEMRRVYLIHAQGQFHLLDFDTPLILLELRSARSTRPLPRSPDRVDA